MILHNNQRVVFGQFPNGEVNLKKIRIAREDINQVVTLKYEDDRDLFHLLMVRKAITVPAILRITYAPYSRMDRDSDVYTFSLKVFTEFINSMNWDKVIIYEPHSDVLPALLDRVQVVNVTAHPYMRSKISIELGTDHQVCYPDVGAFKRYSEKFKAANPLIGFKVRDFETGKIVSLSITGEHQSDNVAIVDDLCSKGGTFVLAARALRQKGFKKIVLAVAHCEYAIFEGEVFNSNLIDHVITTDSILDYSQSFKSLSVISLGSFA